MKMRCRFAWRQLIFLNNLNHIFGQYTYSANYLGNYFSTYNFKKESESSASFSRGFNAST